MNSARELTVEGELLLELDRSSITRVRAADDLITVDLSNLGAARTLVTSLPHGAAVRRAVREFLVSSGLTLRVRLRGRDVAELSAASKASPLARLLGLPGLRVRPWGLVAALVVPRRASA